MRTILLALALLVNSFLPSVAAEVAAPPWQEVVEGQIEAFRSGDAEAALGFAATGFQAQFTEPEAFMIAIAASGYSPILESRSHSLGSSRRIGEDAAVQVVNFVGYDQRLHEGVYQMVREEDETWRVQGVVLRRRDGVGI